jgi:uncharacterized protein YndB with AHSA1/START domain
VHAFGPSAARITTVQRSLRKKRIERRIMSSKRIDRASRVINAAPEAIYAAFVDPHVLIRWLPPAGMTGAIERFEPWNGGTYRITLTYREARAHAKSSDQSDVVEGRFLELVPAKRIVQLVTFESQDPAFGGEMTMTWNLEGVPGGTKVEIRAENVPAGIRPEDHAAGMASTLSNLASFVE